MMTAFTMVIGGSNSGVEAAIDLAKNVGRVTLINYRAALDWRDDPSEDDEIEKAIREGALLRVRPMVMTVAVILAGLGSSLPAPVPAPDRRPRAALPLQ